MRRALIGSAAVALVTTLVAVPPASAKTCKRVPVYADALTEAQAISVWTDKVTDMYGAAWAIFSKAKDRIISPISVNGQVVTTKAGGYPCLYVPPYRNVPSNSLKPR